MTPEELKHQSLKPQCNNIEPLVEADLMELDILQASKNLCKYQEETRKWRDKKVVDKFISARDQFLKRNPNSETIRKLQSKWDGPYLVLYSSRSGSYHLADLERNELQHPWNPDSLKNNLSRIILYERFSCNISRLKPSCHVYPFSFCCVNGPHSFPHRRKLHIGGEVFNEADPM